MRRSWPWSQGRGPFQVEGTLCAKKVKVLKGWQVWGHQREFHMYREQGKKGT